MDFHSELTIWVMLGPSVRELCISEQHSCFQVILLFWEAHQNLCSSMSEPCEG